LRSLKAAGFEDDELAGLYSELVDTSFWLKNGASPHSIEVCAALHENTWSAIDGSGGVLQTHRGAAAGTTLAGAFFSVAVSRPIRALRAALKAAKLLPSFMAQETSKFFGARETRATGSFDILDVSFVDDVASAMESDAKHAIDTAIQGAEIAATIYRRCGMPLNFAAGKTEVLIRWAGKGADTVRRNALLDSKDGVITRWTAPDAGPFFRLRIVDEYKHLGTFMTSIGSALRDVTVRLNAMDQAARGFIRRLFPDDEVEDTRKLATLEVYIFTKGLFHIGTWAKLGPKLEHKVHNRIMRLYRFAVGESWKATGGTCISDQAVIEKHKLVAPVNLIVLARIQLFGRAALKAPEYLLQILSAAGNKSKQSWLAAIVEDIKLLTAMAHFRQSKFALLLGGDVTDIATWADTFSCHKGKARTAFIALIRDPLTNSAASRPMTKLRHSTLVVHDCPGCSRVFPSKQQAAVHAFRQHKIRPDLRTRVLGADCFSCLMRFSNGPALHNHLANRSKACGVWYSTFVEAVNEDDLAEELEQDRLMAEHNLDKGKARYKVLQPAGQLSGPQPFGAPARHEFRPHRHYD
jgi:hypothetical protein